MAIVVSCPKCEEKTVFGPENIKWDFSGMGYDTKYVVCPECGRIIILKYVEDENFDVNNDERYYEYGVKGGK